MENMTQNVQLHDDQSEIGQSGRIGKSHSSGNNISHKDPIPRWLKNHLKQQLHEKQLFNPSERV